MSLTTDAATARLARELHASEGTISQALVAASALLHTAALAEQDIPDAPALKVQSALLHLNKMIHGLIEVRGEAMRVHGQLLDIGREMGATETPYCPPNTAELSDQQRAA